MSTPPYRADHVGSLLRPPAIKAARAVTGATTLSASGFSATSALSAVEDDAIKDAVTLQEKAGLHTVTDGEYRRSFWHYDFMGALHGLELVMRAEEGVQFHGVQLPPIFPTITDRLSFPPDHPMLDHFRYLASVASVTPKISIPGPSACHFRTAPEDIAPEAYEDLHVLFADIAAVYKDAVAAFYAAGCRYLQLDDIFFAYLCDPKQRAVESGTRTGS